MQLNRVNISGGHVLVIGEMCMRIRNSKKGCVKQYSKRISTMEAHRDKEKDEVLPTDPHKGGTRPAGSGETNIEVVPMQLDKDNLDAITKGMT